MCLREVAACAAINNVAKKQKFSAHHACLRALVPRMRLPGTSIEQAKRNQAAGTAIKKIIMSGSNWHRRAAHCLYVRDSLSGMARVASRNHQRVGVLNVVRGIGIKHLIVTGGMSARCYGICAWRSVSVARRAYELVNNGVKMARRK